MFLPYYGVNCLMSNLCTPASIYCMPSCFATKLLNFQYNKKKQGYFEQIYCDFVLKLMNKGVSCFNEYDKKHLDLLERTTVIMYPPTVIRSVHE